MGETKRRKTALGEKYGQEAQIFPCPIHQAQQFVKWSNRGACWYRPFGCFLVTVRSLARFRLAVAELKRKKHSEVGVGSRGKNSSHCPLLFFPNSLKGPEIPIPLFEWEHLPGLRL